MKGFRFKPISLQKKKHAAEQEQNRSEYHHVINDKQADESDQQMHYKIKKQLENLPRLTFKTTRFYRHEDEMQSTIDKLTSNGFKNINSKKLTENFMDVIYETYMIMPGEAGRIMKSALVGSIAGGLIGAFHGAGLISLPALNPASAGGAAVITLLGIFIEMILSAAFTAILQLFRPLRSIEPGYFMLSVYGDLEYRRQIEDILSESVTVEI